MSSFRLLCALAIPVLAAALYGPSSSVVQLTENDLKNILKSDELWLIEFYAPWCGHCKNLVPEWDAAASQLRGIVKVGALDGTQYEKVMQKYQVKGFPTIKIFGADKKNPVDYQGERKTDAIVNEAMSTLSKIVKERKGGKGKKSEESRPKSDSGSKKSSGGSDVVELTEANFNALVMESNDIWLVEFFAPWCGHCKNLAPEWEAAASQLKGSVKLGAVDATAHGSLAGTYGVKGYPTIKVFPAGKKGKAVDYNGPREAGGIVEYANRLLEESNVPPPITQITNQAVLNDLCSGKKLCAIMFLPDILDTGAEGRNRYLTQLSEVAKKLRGKPFSFVWSEGGAQPELEQRLEVTFGYPAFVLLATEKKAFALMKTSWTVDNIVSFVNGVMGGRCSNI